ncbi:MAG TPA: vWA domain-containing protein, partial [Pirellulales bacterium]|nr:vWA domain-containing protein [Pirellulales bacterium]
MSLLIPLLAEGATRHAFELARVQSPTDWLLPVAVFAALALYVVGMYRRDTVELRPAWTAVLIALRTIAILGIAVIYLQPQWSNERETTQPSRVVMLVDTSLSMATDDHDATPSEPNRAQQLASMFEDAKLLDRLRQKHDIAVYRFDLETKPITLLDQRKLADTHAPDAIEKTHEPFDWRKALEPRGPETRLGQALREVINNERAAPLSAVVVWTDGQQNAGPDAASVLPLVREVGVPIYAVGIGSTATPQNVRISDFVVPARAYPGDQITVTGYVQAVGMAGRTVTVELLSRQGSGSTDAAARLEATEQLTLAADAEPVPVKFQIAPGDRGRRTLVLRVRAPVEDRNVDDNQREAAYEVVDRETQVLLLAGGPTREYQFLRNVLRRDKNTQVDVLLQTGSEGISQD